MTTDPAVTVVFFASVFLIGLGVFALIEDWLRRQERRAAREWRRRMNRCGS